MQYIINLTSEEDTAVQEMGIDLESYIKSICSSHISQKLIEDFSKLSQEEQKELMTK